MTKRLRAGIIGLGVGEAHIPGYEAAGVEVVALCDFDTEKLQLISAKYPSISSLYSSPQELLDNASIDVVSIASYDEYHCEQIIRGLENGKHLFVEKPLCLSPEEAFLIRASIQAHPAQKIASNLILRHSPRFSKLREMMTRGDLGEVYHVEGDYLYGRLEKITKGWRGRSPGYTVTLGGGIHIVDLLLWLTNDVVTEVRAIGGKCATRGTQVTFPDTVTALLVFKSGMTGKISANFPSVHPHFHKLAIYGDKGTFENAVDGARWFKERGSHEYSPIDDAYLPTGKHLLLTEFVKEVQGYESLSIDTESVFRALSVCFAIDEAVRTGNTVCVKYV